MAEVNNPIKTGDLFQDDGTIDKLIADLERLRDKYVKSIDEIQKKANTLDQSLRKLSGTTDEQKRAAQEAAVEADRLSRSYKEMKKEAAALESEIVALRRQKAELTSATQEETKATQAEAKTTQELNEIVEGILGTRAEVIKQLAAEQAALAKLRQQKANLAKVEKDGMLTAEEAATRRERIIRAEQEHKTASAQLQQSLNAETKQMQAAGGSMNEMSQLLGRLRMAYRDMTAAERNSPLGEATRKNIGLLDSEMKKLDASIGNYQRNVGNYGGAFTPLQYQVQQVARELPSLTMSAQQFFLAISNNLPMLADELSRARREYKNLKAEGKDGVPVWKQLLKSIASWQTLLVVGITAVTAYGKEIGNFFKKLFTGKKQVDALTKAQEAYNQVMIDGARDAQKDIVHLDGLYNAVTNVALSMDKRRIALKKLKDEYPDYLKGMSDEQVLAGKAVTAYEKLRAKLVELAKARAAEDMLQKNEQQKILIENTDSYSYYSGALREVPNIRARYEDAMRRMQETEGSPQFAAAARDMQKWRQIYNQNLETIKRLNGSVLDELKELEGGEDLVSLIADKYGNSLQVFLDASNKLSAKLARISEPVYTTIESGTTDGGTETSGMTPEQKANALSLKLQKEYEQSRIDQMRESAAKRRAKIENDAEWEINELTQKYAKMEGIDKEGSEVFEQYWSQIENIERKKTEDLVRLDLDYAIETRQILQDNLDARLKYIRSGSEEEYRLRMESLRNMAELDKLQARKEGKLTLDRELDIDLNATYSEGQAAIDVTQSMFGRGMDRNDRSYALQMSRIDASGMTERDKYVAQLNAEKAYWEERLRLAREYGGLLTAEDLEIAQNTIKAIEIEKEKAKRPRDLWDVMGFKLDDEQKQAISESVSFALEQMTAILDAEIEMAQQAVDAANERVTAAQSALDAEMQAKANGLAYSQTEAEKRLAMEKQNQAKAIAEQKKAQKQKAQIETLQQISSLVTASAAIWGALVLPWLAIPAIAIMWATFGAAKIKASQLAKSSNGTEQYGDGTYEFIDGGSHQSGNDVPLGINPKTGKERRVEGGEMFAVVNKAGVRKYRSELPAIINSLNRGEFDRTYIRAAFAAPPTPVVVNAMGDNRKMADDIAAIRRLSERQVYTDAKGRTVIRYKNLTRKIN